MKHLDLFSGIGGFALAIDNVWGKENVEHIFCDNEPFAQQVIKKHWPDSKIYGDIRLVTNAQGYRRNSAPQQEDGAEEVGQPRGRRPDDSSDDVYLLTGGFPCQPFSQAGRRKGTDDDRFLWPEMLRVIREFKPRWVIGENVAGLLTIEQGVVFGQVLADLENEGYEVQPFVIPAVAVNAPHRRDRVWIVAFNAKSERENPKSESSRERLLQRSGHGGNAEAWDANWIEVAAKLCTLDDGFSDRLVRPKGWRNAALKGAGNAIVPAVAVEIFKGIKAVDENIE